MPIAPWSQPSGIDPVVQHWLASGYVRPCLTADELVGGQSASFEPLPSTLDRRLAAALRQRGIEQLYSHQAEAYRAARAGRHVVIATPTASGKSLCFHLPVLQSLFDDPQACALYLFPTKALARDQEAAIGELVAASGAPARRIVYDGDTPGDARRAARERGAIVLSNPDMLSAGILPHHAQWARMFSALQYIVIDELHTYRGVFGSHMAHVIARLLRIAAFHGSRPIVLSATATIGNPLAHAARLFGFSESEIALVDRSGAPRGNRRFFLFNPPVVNAELGVRASYVKSAVHLAADLVRRRVPTIVFGPSRNSVEIMLKYLRERCEGEVPEEAIMAYRGGYLPETRRRIEKSLRDGELLGVVATSALELGIDIGALDAVVCASYPGSIAALWQRFGRAGRRRGTSIAVLVASSAPTDQFFAQHPDVLLGASAEEARIDPHNVQIVLQHLKCAAFEMPFVSGEPYAGLDGDSTTAALRLLVRNRVLHEAGGRFHWAADAYPAHHVSLRSVGWDNFAIIDEGADEPKSNVIAELDWRATHTMLHEQAIYQHDGEQYQVERLDFENHKAFVKKVLADYFTEAMVDRKVSILEEAAERRIGSYTVGWGEVSVVEKVTGYKKIKFHTHENAGYGEVRLPDMQMHTTAFWLIVPETVYARIGRASAVDALGGIGRALETIASISLMCEPRDLGRTIEDDERAPQKRDGARSSAARFAPTLFLFEHVPGGVGLAERTYERAVELFAHTRELIGSCRCADGCPACVGPVASIGSLRKPLALELLAGLLDAASSGTHSLPRLRANDI